ncbi:MAG TPA: hypothetical protein VIH57_02685, partial [Bacteroidales bacterium]
KSFGNYLMKGAVFHLCINISITSPVIIIIIPQSVSLLQGLKALKNIQSVYFGCCLFMVIVHIHPLTLLNVLKR